MVVYSRRLLVLAALLALTACRKTQEEAPPSPPSPPPARPAPKPPPPQEAREFPSAPAADFHCNPVGMWEVTSTRTNASGGACATDGFASRNTRAMVMTTPEVAQVRWVEDGATFTASIELSTCTADFDLVKTARFPNTAPATDGGDAKPTDGGASTDAGDSYTSTLKIHRHLRFDGQTFTGTDEADFTTDPLHPDNPCHVTYDVQGKHL